MDADRFDKVTRILSDVLPRRGVLGRLVAMYGLGALLPTLAGAKNRKERKPPPRNKYGCVNVGKPCRGKDRLCCSGNCKGKKPKPGKKDTSRCVGHDASTCQPGQTVELCGGTKVECETSLGTPGQCVTTTGKAAYCEADGECFACQKDADCRRICGRQAACIPCSGCATVGTSTACVGVGPNTCIV